MGHNEINSSPFLKANYFEYTLDVGCTLYTSHVFVFSFSHLFCLHIQVSFDLSLKYRSKAGVMSWSLLPEDSPEHL